MSVALAHLVEGIDAERLDAGAALVGDVERVTINSRRVGPRTLFVACRGATAASRDGHDFIDAAVASGAVALVVEDGTRVARTVRVPTLLVKSSRRAAAILAERAAGEPSRGLSLVGVTGTNGKTTTTFLLAHITAHAGMRSAVLGTLGVGPVGALKPLGFTTPEAEELSDALRALRNDGAAVVAMETSSHALATARVDGVSFSCAAFTNLTRDHLDFHGTMDAYLDAKLRLFSDLLPRGAPAVIPADDDEHGAGARLRALRPDALTWGLSDRARLRALDVKKSARGFSGVLDLDGRRASFESPLVGGYNLENLLVAIGCALSVGVPFDVAAAALATAGPPPGRLERVSAEPGGPTVIVDYAHTPDALERALHALRDVTTGRLFCVFGCGGDRDAGKRALMGAVAAEVADCAIVTDDNPRSEDGDRIIEVIAAGMTPRMREVPARALEARTFARSRSRRFAIRSALAAALEEDTVLVAGKGHEKTQTVGARVLPFDDVRECARALRGESAPAFLERELVEQCLSVRGLRVQGSMPDVFCGVSTDSRHVEPASLFVALKGDNFDAHHFVEAAFAAGAAAALVEHGRPLPGLREGALLFAVDDALGALQDLARAHLARLPGRRVAITGSNGKTTTKQLVHAALSAVWGGPAVLATEGNLNNHIGVPLTALCAQPEHEALVIEMGMNHLGEIDLLAGIAAPHVGLITNMGTAHAGNVGGVEGVARAKAELWERMRATGGVAVVNADDARCVREAQSRAGELKLISFGRAPWADVRLVGVRDLEDGGQHLDVACAGVTLELRVPLEGRHNAQNACGALAVGLALHVDLAACARGIAAAARAHGRLERTAASCGALILDDTYNANPDSMAAAFSTVRDLAHGRRMVMALGEMRELGDLSEQAHRNIGAAAVHAGAQLLLTCGDHGRFYAEAARGAGLPASAVEWAPDSASLAPLAVARIASDDIVLVKGSRGARMERVVQALTRAGEG